MKRILITLCFLCAIKFSPAQHGGDPKLTEIWNPVPKVVAPGRQSFLPPSDAVVLFASAKDTANWTGTKAKAFNWNAADSFMTVVPGAADLQTKKSFGDCQLHIEWRTPPIVKGEGQGRGNSGIFFMGRYELQVLDSYNNKTYSNGQAASLYKQHMPMANASRGPGEWQSYDVIFTAPRFYEDSMVKSPARITVFHNGVLVQNNVELWGPTQYIGVPKYAKHAGKEPFVLQDHGDLVSYRNIWIREL
ncbi:MAG TPA: DUF1080 domain-containing protein [Flavisolibacter sp.]|nr:DUF1080 domain-containing protein [Flavisolibacter sp.]